MKVRVLHGPSPALRRLLSGSSLAERVCQAAVRLCRFPWLPFGCGQLFLEFLRSFFGSRSSSFPRFSRSNLVLARAGLLARLVAALEVEGEVAVDRQGAERCRGWAGFGDDLLRLGGGLDVGLGFGAGARRFGQAEEAPGPTSWAPPELGSFGRFRYLRPGFAGLFELLARFGGVVDCAGFGVDFGQRVAGADPGPGQGEQQRPRLPGSSSACCSMPLACSSNWLGGVADRAAAAEQAAEVDRADDEEEAGAHQQGEDRVDDFDDVFAPSRGCRRPSAARRSPPSAPHCSWVEGSAMPPACPGRPKARASKILNSKRTSSGTISISIETGSTPGRAAATIAMTR